MSGGTPLGNMVIKLGLDDADFGRGVANSQKQVRYLAKEMQANMKIADMAGNSLGKLQSKFSSLTNIVQAQEKQVNALKTAYDKSFDDNGKATEATKRYAAQLQEANGKLANYKQQLIQSAGALAEYKVKNEGLTGAIYKGSEKMISAGDKMASVGGKLTTGLTLPIAGAALAVGKAAISWESAFAGVKKTNDEVINSTGQVVYSYKDLENGLRGLAKELPASHAEIANVAEAAGQLGIQTPNVVGFTKTMIDLGESTNMSAETAATSLARFANITQMSQKDFDRLGSVIVDLGNNFATTESEITEMGLRLAGAGKQLGMSQGEIMGLATALSSVGIEAEAGGSAFSKVMVNMQLAVENGVGAFDELSAMGSKAGLSLSDISKAVQDGGKNLKSTAGQMGLTNTQLRSMYKEADKSAIALENFSKVAGMTNAEFADLFKKDPSKAIMKFVEGLSHAEEKGTSAIKVLNDMDIKEVRLRDSLLRAANASGVFGDAIEMGNKAWKENTALTNEASKRYETTESKLKMLKNEAVDAAIELGGPLIDALRDGLQASKPLIKGLGDLAKSFSSLDKEQQQNIIKWVGIAAAAGPVLSIAGKLTGGIGKLGKSFIDLTASMAKKKAMTAMAAEMASGAVSATSMGTAVAGAGTKVGLFGKLAGLAGGKAGVGALTAGLSGVAVPAAIAVGGVAAVGIALYAANKAYESNQLAGARWGTKVTKEQDNVIKKAYELNEKASTYVNEYADGIASSAEKAKKANQEIVNSIQKVLDKEIERKKKAAENIVDDAEKKKAENYIKWQETVNKAEVQQAQKKVDAINQVLTNASKNSRNLSNEERQFIANNYKLLSQDQLKAAGFSKKQRLAIETAYQADMSKLNYKDLSKRQETLQTALKDEKSAYEKQVESLKTIYAKNPQALKASMDKLNKEYKQSTDTLVTGLAKVFQAQGKDISQLSEIWKAYGYTTDEVLSLVNTSIKASSDNLDLLAKGTSEADMAWNALALDPKTGEVKTNMAETLVDMAKTDEGWQQLKFMLKNANIESNAKEEVAVAMGLAGKWNLMYMSDKLLTVNGDEAKVALYDTIDELKAWNEYEADRKILGADNADVIWKLIDSEDKLNVWNTIPASDKKLLADNTDFLSKLLNSEEALNQWNSLPDSQKKMLADNSDLLSKIFTSTETFKAWGKLPEPVKQMLGNNKDILAKVKDGTISVETYNKNIIPALKVLFGDGKNLQNAISGATASISRYNKNIFPNDKTAVGHDQASGAANNAYSAFRNFMNNIPDTVTKTAKVNFIGPSQYATGTNYHLGGPAIVNDQKGLTYKELVLPKGGVPFIPEGRDVFLPDLPRGSKIIPARQTKKLVPHYKDGVGVPKNSTLIRNLENISTQNNSSKTEIKIEKENYSEQLSQIIKLIGRFSSDLQKLKIVMNEREVGRIISNEQMKNNRMQSRLEGLR
ncbi:phage tail tape measure protein, TP901 family, core region [Enterococcus sp. DIV0755b]|uniref:phage tail tape measure protein n=1 Tax=Enterococcus sp. DIV0755b TaxID=2774657 RepID=UPI003F22B1A3